MRPRDGGQQGGGQAREQRRDGVPASHGAVTITVSVVSAVATRTDASEGVARVRRTARSPGSARSQLDPASVRRTRVQVDATADFSDFSLSSKTGFADLICGIRMG